MLAAQVPEVHFEIGSVGTRLRADHIAARRSLRPTRMGASTSNQSCIANV